MPPGAWCARWTAPLTAGSHTVEWDGLDDAGRASPNGVLFYSVAVGAERQTMKLVRLRWGANRTRHASAVSPPRRPVARLHSAATQEPPPIPTAERSHPCTPTSRSRAARSRPASRGVRARVRRLRRTQDPVVAARPRIPCFAREHRLGSAAQLTLRRAVVRYAVVDGATGQIQQGFNSFNFPTPAARPPTSTATAATSCSSTARTAGRRSSRPTSGTARRTRRCTTHTDLTYAYSIVHLRTQPDRSASRSAPRTSVCAR